MNMTISITDEVAAKLQERAASNGQSVPDYTAALVTETLSKPTIDELLAPVRAQCAASGMTEEAIMDFGRGLLAEVRRDRKARPT